MIKYACFWCGQFWRDEGALLFHKSKVHGIDLPSTGDCEHHFPYRMMSLNTDMAACSKCGYEATAREMMNSNWSVSEH